MREVIPSQLWIGGAGDIANPKSLYEAGIATVLHLVSSHLPETLSREIIYCRIPLIDGAENPPERLMLAISTGVSLLQSRLPTLIACSAGMSRSPSITAAVLAVVQQRSADETLAELLDGAPSDVAPGLWASVKQVVEIMQTERS